MNMKYRGNRDSVERHFLEVQDTNIIGGKYRGCEWTYKMPHHVPQIQPKIGLQYRGITYCARSLSVSEVEKSLPWQRIIGSNPVISVKEDNNLQQVHLNNIRRNLEKRIQTAKENENYSLLAMLEKESRELNFAL